MKNDWDDAIEDLRSDVLEHGGFLTMQRDTMRERFGIGRLSKSLTRDLVDTLKENELIVFPYPSEEVTTFRVYDLNSHVGKIARAVLYPQDVPETALKDAAEFCKRTIDGKLRKSICVPWLSALDVFLQLVIGRLPEDWEDLDDGREVYQLAKAIATSLELPTDIIHLTETIRMAGEVYACRPRGPRWKSAPLKLGTIFAEAARKQKNVFEGVLREAAKHLLGEAEIPSRDVDLGRLGLRYRSESHGDL